MIKGENSQIVAAALLVVLVAAVVVLVETGHDPTVIAVLLSGPAVSGLLGLLLVNRASAITDMVGEVRDQTNGLLTGKLAKIQAQAETNGELLKAAVVTRAANAQAIQAAAANALPVTPPAAV